MSATFILNLPHQLTASRVNILAARLSDRSDNTGIV
jgi:hypothetical protein